MMSELLWWGYLHTNNTAQVKRLILANDIGIASESPFVKFTVGPFETREKVIKAIEERRDDG